jgi:hypothetical protein
MGANGSNPQEIPGEPQGNRIGTVGFGFSLAAALIGLIPVLFIISWILAPVGIILGGAGLVNARNGRGHERRSRWAVILGVIAMALPIAWLIAL